MILPSNHVVLIFTGISLLPMGQINRFTRMCAVNYPDPERFLYTFCLHILNSQVYTYINFRVDC